MRYYGNMLHLRDESGAYWIPNAEDCEWIANRNEPLGEWAEIVRQFMLAGF